MSMGAIVSIVLIVCFLILGLILIRQIFGTATKSVNILDNSLSAELQKIFADENKNLVIYLGDDKTARIKAGTTDFGIGIASQTLSNIRISNLSDVQYKFTLNEDAPTSCINTLGKAATQRLFQNKFDTWIDSSGADGPISKFQIKVNIPSSTQTCKQQVTVYALDRTVNPDGDSIAIDSFYIEVLKKGLF